MLMASLTFSGCSSLQLKRKDTHYKQQTRLFLLIKVNTFEEIQICSVLNYQSCCRFSVDFMALPPPSANHSLVCPDPPSPSRASSQASQVGAHTEIRMNHSSQHMMPSGLCPERETDRKRKMERETERVLGYANLQLLGSKFCRLTTTELWK